MKRTLYTMPNSSMYVEIVKIRYRSCDYIKARLNYYTKPGLTLFATENSVKLKLDTIKMWEKHER